jgi:hypothetical protein
MMVSAVLMLKPPPSVPGQTRSVAPSAAAAIASCRVSPYAVAFPLQVTSHAWQVPLTQQALLPQPALAQHSWQAPSQQWSVQPLSAAQVVARVVPSHWV